MKPHLYRCGRRLFPAIGLLVALLLMSKSQAGTPALAQSPQTAAFVNVTVIPMDTERVLENQTVIVEGDRITAIGPADEVTVPDGTEIIDGNGAYLMPGLADMHMHIVGGFGHTFEGPDQLRLYLAEGVTTVRNMSALSEHLVWRDEIARGERLGPTMYAGRQVVGLPDELQSMATTFRAIVIFSPLVIGLLLWLLVWVALRVTGRQAQFGQIRRYVLPSLAGLLLLGGVAAWLKLVPLTTYVSLSYPFATVPETEPEARRYVRDIATAGYDFVKPYDFLREDVYLAVLDEAGQQNMYTVGHALDELAQDLDTMFGAGLREVAHMDEFTDAHMIGEASPGTGFNEVEFNYDTISRTVATVKAHDVMVVSNLVADETIYRLLEDPQGGLAQPEYLVVSPEVVEGWQTRGRLVSWQGQQTWRRDVQMPFLMTLTNALHDGGVPLLIGTDVSVEGVVPSLIHRDLELLVDAGLSPFEALEAGTRNAGMSVERMGGDGSFGTVAIGQRADLILLANNPLDNVSHTRNRIGVMARGQWFTQAELNGLVNEYVATYRAGGIPPEAASVETVQEPDATPTVEIRDEDMQEFVSTTEFFRVRVPSGWSTEERVPGSAVVMANSEPALDRYTSGSAVEPGDLVINVGFLPYRLLQSNELRSLDFQYEAPPDVFLQSLLPMFRTDEDLVIGDAELISLNDERDAGMLTVSGEGREGMILMFAAGDGVIALVSTVASPGEMGAFQDISYAVAATVAFSGANDALYGALLGG